MNIITLVGGGRVRRIAGVLAGAVALWALPHTVRADDGGWGYDHHDHDNDHGNNHKWEIMGTPEVSTWIAMGSLTLAVAAFAMRERKRRTAS